MLHHRDGVRSRHVPNGDARQRRRARLDAVREYWQRRGHRIDGYDGTAGQGGRTVQRGSDSGRHIARW